MSLTLVEADRIMDAAVAKARELGFNVSIAIVDAGAHLVAFKRMDGAIWAGVFGSQGKASTSAAYGMKSGVLEGAADNPVIVGVSATQGPGALIPAKGGVPLVRDGVVVGGIGAGGATDVGDEQIAEAGAAKL